MVNIENLNEYSEGKLTGLQLDMSFRLPLIASEGLNSKVKERRIFFKENYEVDY